MSEEQNLNELEAFHDAVGSENSGQLTTRSGDTEVARSAPMPAQPSMDPATAWAVRGGVLYSGISQSMPKLPPGCYLPQMTDNGTVLQKQDLHTDSLLDLPDSKSREVIEEIKHFQTLRGAFKQRGLLFKRGVLLWGPPGSGKTSTLHLLMRLIIEKGDGIALLIGHPAVAEEALKLIRRIEPNRQVIGVMEDLDGLVHHYSVESYLSMLDGESQIDNVVFIATTNYPERLDKRFVDRPSRFDTVQYVGMPTPEARECYLRHKEPGLPDADIAAMVDCSEGMSIAHLRELIILTQCFGKSLEEATMRLVASRKQKLSSDRAPGATAAGFGGNQMKALAESIHRNATVGSRRPSGRFVFPNHMAAPAKPAVFKDSER